MPLPLTGGEQQPGIEIAIWMMAIGIMVSTVLSILALLGLLQGIQVKIWKSQIEARIRILESYAKEVSELARSTLAEAGAKDPDRIVEVANNYFEIEPVSIEPIDIIRRLERVIRTAEERIEALVDKAVPSASKQKKQIIVTILSISNALTTIYKYVRHILLTGVKNKNALLIAQLWMMLPMILRIAKSYHDAAPGISEGKPIGDAAGPLVAYKLARRVKLLEGPKPIAKDTVYTVGEYEGRRIIIVKAEGPGSTVGRPGEAVEKLIRDYDGQVDVIITVDAALKFEGEPTGAVAEGAGAAIGDPGPEKIRIERAASRAGIPLYAIVVKMGLEEAIQTITKEIVEGVDKALERVLDIVKASVSEGHIAIVVGVGNTLGVAQ